MLVRVVLLLAAVVLGTTGVPIVDSVNTKLLEVEDVPDVGKYIYNNVPANWTEALKRCQVLGGHLAVINSQGEFDALKELMTKFATTAVHIGFHDKFIEHTYVTNDDERILGTSPYWRVGSPGNGNTGRNCGGLTPTGIVDIDCSVEQTAICEIRTWDEYDSYDVASRYNFHPEKRTWSDAWDVCDVEGGHLLVLDSPAEAEAVAGRYRTDIWVGAHRVHGDDFYLTVNNRYLESSGFSQWAANYPFGDAKSHPYVALTADVLDPSSPTLYTFTSTGQLAFVCETERTAA